MASRCYTTPILASSARSLARRTSKAPRLVTKCPARRYAQVGSTTFLGEPPSPPNPPPPPPPPASASASSPGQAHPPPKPFDAHVLSELRKAASSGSGSATTGRPTPLTTLVDQYMKRAGHVLESSLPYESQPGAERRAAFSSVAVAQSAKAGEVRADVSSADGALVMVAHAVQERKGGAQKVAYSSGFVVHAPGTPEGEAVVVTCAHTLEEIRHDPLLRASLPSPAVHPEEHLSGSFIIAGQPPSAPLFHPVQSVLSAMHRADLLLLSASLSPTSAGATKALRSLPVNPYPVQPGTPIRAHFVVDKPPTAGRESEGWTPWVGGTWRKWVRGSVIGYRDFAGREAKPGTYDSLAHLHFDPPPTPGSSGGPIIDEESGAVIGVILGTQFVSQLQGVRGWGVPAETIFEMFSLPGLKLKSRE
ncbi:hypothetical protein OH77DRAFT_1418085 [Trametes cingulata]|nr:hypothetical protein OH77DRAFT_1418085 [Trametes cingulata]